MERGPSAELRDERFEGGVFSSSLPGGRSGARLTIAADGVVATTPEGEEYMVPFAGAGFELGGASGQMWFCRTPDRTLTIFCEAPGFASRLRAVAGPEAAGAISAIHSDAQQTSRRSTLLVLAGLAVLAVLVVGFSTALRAGASRSIAWVPVAVDKQLGDLAVEHMELSGHVTDDKLLNTSVRTLVERLEKHTQSRDKFTYNVRVVEGSTVNAFALPGGQIVVYTGLLREAGSAEQVAGVLAHEMAHVTRRHGMQRIVQSVGVVAAFQLLFGDLSGIMAIAAELLREGAINSYSRDHEHEADMEAVGTMSRAHLDADALAEFFATLQRQHGDLPAMFKWLGTHPDLAARIRAVRAERSRLGDPKSEPLVVDWSAVRARAGFHGDDTEVKPTPTKDKRSEAVTPAPEKR